MSVYFAQVGPELWHPVKIAGNETCCQVAKNPSRSELFQQKLEGEKER
jgi:hypothetical protein